MKKFVKLAALTAVAMGLATSAEAITVTASAAGQTTTTVTGATTVNFNNGTLAGYASGTGNYKIVQGSVGGEYATPYTDTTKYITVAPYSSGVGNSATFKLGTVSDYFGLFWGSIDTYNSITFLLGNTELKTYTGAQLPSLSANGGQVQWSSNRYINFNFGNQLFDTVKFTSTSKAFESDNHAFRAAAVNEPFNLALIGIGLISLVATRRFNKAA